VESVHVSLQLPVPPQATWQFRVQAVMLHLPLLADAQVSVQPLPEQPRSASPEALFVIWQLPPGQSRLQLPCPLHVAVHPPCGQLSVQVPAPEQVKLQPVPAQVLVHAVAAVQAQV
jgi:hypothetical protein